MKILIIGASGLVGEELYRQCKKTHQTLGTYNNHKLPQLMKLDITDKSEVDKLIGNFQPQVVIISAYYADVDGCEKNPALCKKINYIGVKNAVDGAVKNGALPIFFSSDYIFDGKNGPYQENDKPRPLNIYGRYKLKMEEYIKKSCDKYLIVRTCNVFGWEKQAKNFVIRLVDKLKRKETVSVVFDQFGTPTYAPNLVQALLYLAENKHLGTFHLAGKNTMSRLDFGRLISKVFKLDQTLIKPITTNKLNQPANRPLLAGLNTDKASKVLPFPLLSALQGLATMKQKAV